MRSRRASAKQHALAASATQWAPQCSRTAFVFGTIVCLGAPGCSQVRPYVPPSEGHIAASIKPQVDQVIPPPARVSSFVPPPKPTVKPQTYSVVVNEVPVKELL